MRGLLTPGYGKVRCGAYRGFRWLRMGMERVAAGYGGGEGGACDCCGGVMDVMCSLSVGGKEDELIPFCFLD